MKNSYSKKYLIHRVLAGVLFLLSSLDIYAGSGDRSQSLDETALILAGLAGADTGSHKDLVESASYATYKKNMDIAWKKFSDSLLVPAAKWQKQNLVDAEGGTLFYPFSGPDIVNAVTFFPDAKEYVMLGLEKPGEIPSMKNITSKDLASGLGKLERSIHSLIGVNYFFTNAMAEEIGSHPFNGVVGVMMHFLARSGYQILNVEYVTLDKSGNEISAESADKSTAKNTLYKSAKIVFKKRDDRRSESKTVYYFQMDASDSKLALVPEFINFMLQKKDVMTMLKASSYLMFSRYFDDMRSLILSRSKLVMQGASGIPYSYFKSDQQWELKLFGLFKKPTPLFAVRCQPDLANDSRELPAGELNFNYDYFIRGEKSFILLAKRKGTWAPIEPKFDRSMEKGRDTACPPPQETKKTGN